MVIPSLICHTLSVDVKHHERKKEEKKKEKILHGQSHGPFPPVWLEVGPSETVSRRDRVSVWSAYD